MATTQLTLTIDEDLARRLEGLAAEQGTDARSFVTRFLELLARDEWKHEPLAPSVRSATGLAAGLPADRPYKELLEEAIWEKHGKG